MSRLQQYSKHQNFSSSKLACCFRLFHRVNVSYILTKTTTPIANCSALEQISKCGKMTQINFIPCQKICSFYKVLSIGADRIVCVLDRLCRVTDIFMVRLVEDPLCQLSLPICPLLVTYVTFQVSLLVTDYFGKSLNAIMHPYLLPT